MIKFSSRLGELIARNEGWNISGTIPHLRNNPGDLRHSPHGRHEGIPVDAIAIEPSPQLGEEDMERQFHLDAERGMTLQQFAFSYAPPSDGNNTDAYLASLCQGLNLPPTTPLKLALLVPPTGEFDDAEVS